MSLTKSLHTVTSVVNVAKYLIETTPKGSNPVTYVREALRILGYDLRQLQATDPTLDRITRQVTAHLNQSK
jgi:hypothetical protein